MARDVKIHRLTDIQTGERKVRKNGFCQVTNRIYEITVDERLYNQWVHGFATSRAFDLTEEERIFLEYDYTPAEWKAGFKSNVLQREAEKPGLQVIDMPMSGDDQ